MELKIDNLGKRYGNHWALESISFQTNAGMLGLVGPNGAGKTTLMRIISTLALPSKGELYWNGKNIKVIGSHFRKYIGYLPQSFGVYPEFSAREFLLYLADMKMLPEKNAKRKVSEVLELVNLEKDADTKLSSYSGGMKQRVGIAQALLNDPSLLIVDEPTVGLDPAERVRFRTILASLTSERLVILSTHIIGDVEASANRLLIIKNGNILTDTSPRNLTSQVSGRVWSITTDPNTALKIQADYRVSSIVNFPEDLVALRVLSTIQPYPGAIQIEPNLEEAYLLTIEDTEKMFSSN